MSCYRPPPAHSAVQYSASDTTMAECSVALGVAETVDEREALQSNTRAEIKKLRGFTEIIYRITVF